MSGMTHRNIYQQLHASMASVVHGQDKVIRHMLAAFFSGGHVLLEDLPGTGKTTMAKTLALSLDASFQRIQCTPDLLPSDILGVTIYDKNTGRLHFQQGPVFCNVLLADEINRASPRTQAALLEAMDEKQVSIDRKVHALDSSFFVVATQNPIEMHGTNPLPEAQLDRFAVCLHPGYVSLDTELTILREKSGSDPLHNVQKVLSVDAAKSVMQEISAVNLSDELARYIAVLVRATRDIGQVKYGASPRALLALARMSRALAWFDKLDHVTPEHIQEIATPVLAHRLVLATNSLSAGIDGRQITQELLEKTKVPG